MNAMQNVSETPTPARRYPMPFTRIELAVMSIASDRLVVLLGKRAEAPHKGKWALPGGVLRIDLDSDLEAAAQRVATERLGVELPFLRQLVATGSARRDPRAPWALSIAYRALLPLGAIDPQAGKRIEALKWVPADDAAADANIAFDHSSLVRLSVAVTRDEIGKLDLPFDYLPEKFTLVELQACCEAILGHALDKSSFRRRIDDRRLVEPVPGEKLTGGAFRPAQMYRPRRSASGK
ncbi:MAG: NUDIX domain-containing protein [Betaproteobacteria bacterium]